MHQELTALAGAQLGGCSCGQQEKQYDMDYKQNELTDADPISQILKNLASNEKVRSTIPLLVLYGVPLFLAKVSAGLIGLWNKSIEKKSSNKDPSIN